MKKIVLPVALLATFGAAALLDAQNQPARPNGPRGHRPPPPPPLMSILDTDRDGALSAAEIAAAPQTLLLLDANHDGQLTRDEICPPPPDADDSDRGS